MSTVVDSPTLISHPIDRVQNLVAEHLLAVRQSLKTIVPPETELLMAAIQQAMGTQGKLLRPLLTLLASGATGEIRNKHVETAAVSELIHVATLLHDDVLDTSDIRRGRATIRALWGNKISILSGDYLLAQASLKLSRLNHCRLVSIFAEVLANLCEGEVEQIRSSYDLHTSWESYYRKSICKTAALFRACCESAGVLNGLSEPEINCLREFGEKFGIAFQVIDDLLDYTSDTEQLGKPVLDDLKNGLLNAPVLLALEVYRPGTPEYETLKTTIETLFQADLVPSDELTMQKQLLILLENAQIIEKTHRLAKRFTREAVDALQFISANPYRVALEDLATYATDRVH